MKGFKEHDGLNLPNIAEQVLEKWKNEKTFEASIATREGGPSFVFYEGPPSANGMPGIHHVMGRTIKDLFCRYKTQRGFQVNRKAGWDTHGLPVELGVEKELGITKEDIGKKITIEEYNKACREAVMRYTDVWNDLTEKMGYWVDMSDPYVTYENNYIESVWWLLSQLYEKNMLYKGYTIQPYSPAAGTGLSSHELNLPGTYKDVKDTSATALFKVTSSELQVVSDATEKGNLFFMAWTTTPWTLPSNTALTVGANIDYVLIDTFNPYTAENQKVILAKALLTKYFKTDGLEAEMSYTPSDKMLPYRVLASFKGFELVGSRYEQLLPYAQPMRDADKAFQVIAGDFVTTEDGTGIVHTAPTFGADDMQVAKAAGVPPMLVENENGDPVPLVDLQGRFVMNVNDPVWGLAGEPVKAEYLSDAEREAAFEKQKVSLKEHIPNLSNYLSVDERIALKLKLEGKAFKVEKYQHNYPHCWRTDKPILYYPLDSWFIKASSARDKMIALNNTINWKPESTGTGRFGNWLENVNDWNLSRSRYWGTPLPIWRTGPYGPLMEECVGAIAEFTEKNAYYISEECLDEKGNRFDGQSLRKYLGEKRMMGENVNTIWNDLIRSRKIKTFASLPEEMIDLHRPMVDYVIFFRNGLVLARELDLIDVWFDSGAMPYAQWHYPFEAGHKMPDGSVHPAAQAANETKGMFDSASPLGRGSRGGLDWKEKVIPYDKELTERARQMRNNPTEGERNVWQHLKGKQIGGYDFDRQKPLNSFIADFYCQELSLIVEIDGKSHLSEAQQKKDAARDKKLGALGLNTLRFSGDLVHNKIDEVVGWIQTYVSCFEKDDWNAFEKDGINFLNKYAGKNWKPVSDAGKNPPPSPLPRGGSSTHPLTPSQEGELGIPFPADFIAEGVDQTRGWFYTLHAISSMIKGSVAFKNVVSNGLVLDKNGLKMSKRLGNGIDPFETLGKFGPDATRWYMITNAMPWDNLKFDLDGIIEVQRKYFRALHNSYSFFALYANVDKFTHAEAEIPLANRPEIDRWVISRLNSLVKEVEEAFDNYEPTRAGRAIQDFVVDELSNWYVRLCRRRFWKGDYSDDKIAAYQTLYRCLINVAKLSAPIAPFYSDSLFCDLNNITRKDSANSVHISGWPAINESEIDNDLEQRMALAQTASSLALSLRKKENIRVRQPLQKIMIPVISAEFEKHLKQVEDLILSEINVKELEYIKDDGVFVKSIKPNFKALGPKVGKNMKVLAGKVAQFGQAEIQQLETEGSIQLDLDGEPFELIKDDVEISTKDIPGWSVASEGAMTVALDITISDVLRSEGIARELVNRIQNMRKESGLEVTDKIILMVEKQAEVTRAVESNKNYICDETLASELSLEEAITNDKAINVEVEDGISTRIFLQKAE